MKKKQKQEISKIRKKKRALTLIVVGAFLFALLYGEYRVLCAKPQVRMLLGTMHFSNKTLEDPAYLAYGVDVMELIHDYINADVKITGRAGVPSTDKLSASSMMRVSMTRSFSQKRLSASADMALLWMNTGKMEFYAENETVFLYAPMIADDFGYAFPTGVNLFMRMPDLTSDINQEWFRAHRKDIVDLMSEISTVQLDSDYVDENGRKCDCFQTTIPQGSGHFIWELLGMDDPDYDVVSTIWINDKNQFARVYMNLEDVLPGAEMTIEGTSFGRCVFTYQLPEYEWVECIMERNSSRMDWIDVTVHYYANNGEVYNTTCGLHWEDQEEGFDIQVKEAVMTVGDKTIATGYFKGSVERLTTPPDVFGDREQELYGFEVLDWRAVRDDVDGFMQQVTDRMLGRSSKTETKENELEQESNEE